MRAIIARRVCDARGFSLLHMFDLVKYTDYKAKERYTQSFMSSGDIQGIMKKYNRHK